MEKKDHAQTILCTVCEHEHEENGACKCGCEAEQMMEQYCWSCGHAEHFERACKCGCEG